MANPAVVRALEALLGGEVEPAADAITNVGNPSPSLLLESGNTSTKTSALPAFDLGTPPDGSETLPVVEAGATTAITLAQLYMLSTAWLDFIAINPLDAPAASNAAGGEMTWAAGTGDGTGQGGLLIFDGGAGGASGIGGDLRFNG